MPEILAHHVMTMPRPPMTSTIMVMMTVMALVMMTVTAHANMSATCVWLMSFMSGLEMTAYNSSELNYMVLCRQLISNAVICTIRYCICCICYITVYLIQMIT